LIVCCRLLELFYTRGRAKKNRNQLIFQAGSLFSTDETTVE